MASVSEIKICRVCQAFLVDGFCPEGHKQPGRLANEWPDSYRKPDSLHKQYQAHIDTRSPPGQPGVSLKHAAELAIAFENLSDEEAVHVVHDAVRVVQQLLQHKRKEGAMRLILGAAKRMGSAATAIENYIKETGVTEVPLITNTEKD